MSAECYKPNLLSLTFEDSLYDLCEVKPELAYKEVFHSAGEVGCLLWALFSHWRKHRPKKALSVLGYDSLREGHCDQSESTPLIRPMKSFSVFVFLESVSALPQVLGFSQWCLVHS